MGGTTTPAAAADQLTAATQNAQPPQTSAPQQGQQPQLDPTQTPATGTLPAQPVVPPKPMSKFHSGVVDILDDLADNLAGRNRQTVYRDAQTGERVVQKTPMSRGDQFRKLISEGLMGAAAGAAAPQGPGQKLKAAAAGVQAGFKLSNDQRQQQEELSDEDFKAKQEAMKNQANLHLLGVQTAKAQFDLEGSESKAIEGAADQMNANEKFLGSVDAKLLGHFANMGEVTKFTQNNPDAVRDHVQGRLFTQPVYDAEGHVNGFELHELPVDAGQQKTTEDHLSWHLVPGVGKDGKPDVNAQPRLESYTIPAGSVTNAQLAAYLQKDALDTVNAQTKQHEQIEKDKKTAAEVTELRANASRASEEAKKIQAQIDEMPEDLDMKKELADAKAQGKPTGTMQRINILANNGLHNIGELNKLVDAHSDLFGAMAGRYTSIEQAMGSDDPAISAIAKRVHNLAKSSLGAHGIRSQQAIRDEENTTFAQFHMGPKAVKAALAADGDSLQNLADQTKGATGGGTTPAPAAVHPAIAAGVPPGAKPGYKNGVLVGYQDAQGWHDLPGGK